MGKRLVSLRVDEELWKKVKARASIDGVTATDVVINALKTYLGEGKASSQKKILEAAGGVVNPSYLAPGWYVATCRKCGHQWYIYIPSIKLLPGSIQAAMKCLKCKSYDAEVREAIL